MTATWIRGWKRCQVWLMRGLVWLIRGLLWLPIRTDLSQASTVNHKLKRGKLGYPQAEVPCRTLTTLANFSEQGVSISHGRVDPPDRRASVRQSCRMRSVRTVSDITVIAAMITAGFSSDRSAHLLNASGV
jgi:hypothetical protein